VTQEQSERTPVPESGAGFGVREVALLLDATPARVRSWVRAGIVRPRRGARGTLRFSFRDVTLLRQVNELESRRIAPRRVRRLVQRLRDRGEPDLASLGVDTAGGEIVLRDGGTLWSAESGQLVFDFAPPATRATVVAIDGRRREPGSDGDRAAEDWFRLAGELEHSEPERACEAYRRTLELDPAHADAAINLGCLQHGRGRLADAERHYRQALAARPDATACFNLAVVLEDQRRDAEARRAYESALAADPACAEAHFNLASLCERAGQRAAALRHLTAYRRLSR
jgi:tetratricopeptide (TPR) repeat protein